MDAAEGIAARYADTVCLGVGLCSAYGAAQRMYVKRGYIPDGSGVWYRGRQCVQYETVCTVDDDLILFLYKKLRGRYLFSPADRTDTRDHCMQRRSAAWKVYSADPEDYE